VDASVGRRECNEAANVCEHEEDLLESKESVCAVLFDRAAGFSSDEAIRQFLQVSQQECEIFGVSVGDACEHGRGGGGVLGIAHVLDVFEFGLDAHDALFDDLDLFDLREGLFAGPLLVDTVYLDVVEREVAQLDDEVVCGLETAAHESVSLRAQTKSFVSLEDDFDFVVSRLEGEEPKEVFALDGVVDKFLGGSDLLAFDVLAFVGAVDGAGIGRDCVHLLLLVDGDVEETGAHGFARHYEDHIIQHREVYLHSRTHENLLHQVSCLVKHHLVCLLQSEVVGGARGKEHIFGHKNRVALRHLL
jgi:hypothetical protein